MLTTSLHLFRASQRSTDSGSATDEEPPATPSSSPTDKPEEREESEAKTAVEPKLDEQAQKLAEVKTEVQSADEAASMKVKEKKSQEWTRDRIMNDWRRFSLDLSPKVRLVCPSSKEIRVRCSLRDIIDCRYCLVEVRWSSSCRSRTSVDTPSFEASTAC